MKTLKCFAKHLSLSVLPNKNKTLKCFATKHFSVLPCHMPGNCYHICTYCYANYKKDDLHPHRPPTSAAPSATVGAAVTAAMAAALPPTLPQTLPPSPLLLAAATATAAAVSAATTVSAIIAAAFWLIVVCPRAASATATVACPCRCRCWLPAQLSLSLSLRPQTTAPCSFRHNCCLSLIMFKILLRPSIILNIFHATFWLIIVCPRAASAFATVACPRHCVFANLLVIVTTCIISTASCLSSTIMGGSDATPTPDASAKNDDEDEDYRHCVAAARVRCPCHLGSIHQSIPFFIFDI